MIRTIFFALVSTFTFADLSAQTDRIRSQVDSLKYLGADAFDCHSVLWHIVANKKDALPYLMEKLNDTTRTEAIHKCKKTNLCVGDLAYLALEEIIPLPFFAVTGMQCDAFSDGCALGQFEYIENNRGKFKQQVQDWYDAKNKKFKWKNYAKEELNECYRKNNISGRYVY